MSLLKDSIDKALDAFKDDKSDIIKSGLINAGLMKAEKKKRDILKAAARFDATHIIIKQLKPEKGKKGRVSNLYRFIGFNRKSKYTGADLRAIRARNGCGRPPVNKFA